jgi:hypothetical protein
MIFGFRDRPMAAAGLSLLVGDIAFLAGSIVIGRSVAGSSLASFNMGFLAFLGTGASHVLGSLSVGWSAYES